jgi:hypothetical protein
VGPDRLDGQGLEEPFGSRPLYVYGLQQAIEDGRLVPIRQYAIRMAVDLDEVSVRAGDFAEGELGRAVLNAARTQAIVQAYQSRADGRKAIAFAVNLDHVEQLRQAFADAGMAVAAVTGQMGREDRRHTLAAFRAGDIRVVIGCEVLTEGFDEPSIGAVLMARPTKSRALYQQSIGRGLRLYPEGGKADCLVLDVVDNSRRHSLVTATSLLGIRAADAGGRYLREVLREEQEQQRRGRPESGFGLRASAVPVAIALEAVDPFRQAYPRLAGYEPTEPWHNGPATERQKQVLRRRQLPFPEGLTKGQASWLLDQPTPRQERFLKWKRRWRDGLTFEEASARIEAIKHNSPWN